MANPRCPCCDRPIESIRPRSDDRDDHAGPSGRRVLALALWPGVVVVTFVAFLPGTILLAALGVDPRTAAGIVLGLSLVLSLLGAAVRAAVPAEAEAELRPVRFCPWCERTFAENGLANG